MFFRILAALAAFVVLVSPAHAAPPYALQADAMLRNYTEAGRFSGAVLVAKDGKPVFRKAYGWANREWKLATTPDTAFRLGSITKQFTAAAILKLAEQGKLSVDDPIAKYYAAAPTAWAPITLKHLLTHTSGIPSYTAIPGFFTGPLARTDMKPDEIIALTRDKPLEFAPGSRYAYDNTGYILLGYIIEKVSGQTYSTYLQEQFFGPLGLKHTGYDVTEAVLPKRADGYDIVDGTAKNAPFLSMSLPWAAGSLYSTVDDLLAWDLALRSGKAINPASVTAMFTDQGFKYGYGQAIETRDDKRYWHHGGGVNGFTTMLARYPDQHLTLVVLANQTNSDPARITNRLGELYFHPERGGATGAPAAAELERYVGRYKITDTYALDVTREGKQLFVQPTNGAKAALSREIGRSFFGPRAVGYLEFADGPKAAAVVVSRGPARTVGKRVD